MTEIFWAHLMALFTIIIWGITFISTKILLNYISPIEILIYRFFVAYIFLFIMYPKVKKIESLKNELILFFLGFFGITLYFIFENTSLKYTYVSNVSLIMSTIPILTALIGYITFKQEKIKKELIFGFFIAFVGVFFIIFNGRFVLKSNPKGDFLAIIAALNFAIYSILFRKLKTKENHIYITRKIFFYGILTSLVASRILNIDIKISKLLNLNVIINIMFLGLIASAVCFVFWNKAITTIGTVKTSNYIYLSPLVTIIASVLILKEKITAFVLIGGIMTLFGVYVSEYGFKLFFKKKGD